VTAGEGLSLAEAPATSGANMSIRASQRMNLRRPSCENCIMVVTETIDGLKDSFQAIATRARKSLT
jgi:hypothetical protein